MSPLTVTKIYATAHIATSGGSYDTGLPTVAANSSTLQTILEIVFATMGAVAVIIIIIAAISLAVNAGNKDAVEKMRKTLIYAAVGLIISLLAFSIVGFVLSKL